MHKTIGYELRAADPIPYDIEYTRNLGYGAVRFLLCGGSGAMIVFDEGKLRPVSFVELTDPLTGRIRNKLVDIKSENYEVGKKYMIRLEKEDFAPASIAGLAKAAGMSVPQFKKSFPILLHDIWLFFPDSSLHCQRVLCLIIITTCGPATVPNFCHSGLSGIFTEGPDSKAFGIAGMTPIGKHSNDGRPAVLPGASMTCNRC